jgi:hypothetical protein
MTCLKRIFKIGASANMWKISSLKVHYELKKEEEVIMTSKEEDFEENNF